MATLTFTVPDAVVPRIKDAFGKVIGGVRVPATTQEVLDILKNYLHSGTADYEAGVMATQKRSDVSNEVW